MSAVLFVSKNWSPRQGGLENYTQKLVTKLSDDFTLDLVHINAKEDGDLRLMEFLGTISRAVTRVFQNRYRIVHLGDLSLWPVGFVAKKLRKDTLLVASSFGYEISFAWGNSLKSKLWSFYMKLGAAMIGEDTTTFACSNFTREISINAGFKSCQLAIPGVETGAEVCIHDCFPKDGERFIFFVGRFSERKGVSWFINKILPHLSDTKLYLAGPEKSWAKFVEQNRIPSQVVYLGKLPESCLARLRKTAVATIMPNIRTNGQIEVEGFGMTAIEASRDGAILLASEIEGLSDAVINKVTGFKIRSGDEKAWLEALDWAGSLSREQRREISTRASEKTLESYSWENSFEGILKLYRSKLL